MLLSYTPELLVYVVQWKLIMYLIHPNSSVIQSHLLQLNLFILLWPPQEIPSWGCTLQSYSSYITFYNKTVILKKENRKKQTQNNNKISAIYLQSSDMHQLVICWIRAIPGLPLPDSLNQKCWPHLWIQRQQRGSCWRGALLPTPPAMPGPSAA